MPIDPETRRVLNGALEDLRSAGATVDEVEIPLPDAYEYFIQYWGPEYIAIADDMQTRFGKLDSERKPDVSKSDDADPCLLVLDSLQQIHSSRSLKKIADRFDHPRLLGFGQLSVDRKRQRFIRGGLGNRERPGAISQVAKTWLQVQRDRVIDRRAHAALRQLLFHAIPIAAMTTPRRAAGWRNSVLNASRPCTMASTHHVSGISPTGVWKGKTFAATRAPSASPACIDGRISMNIGTNVPTRSSLSASGSSRRVAFRAGNGEYRFEAQRTHVGTTSVPRVGRRDGTWAGFTYIVRP